MMRDICARFKYSERDVAVQPQPPPPGPTLMAPTPREADSVAPPHPLKLEHQHPQPQPQPHLPASKPTTGTSTTEASAPEVVVIGGGRGSPLPLPTPTTNCPSRELIHKCLRRYYEEMEGSGAANLPRVRARIQEDLAPYSVLKLGGFSLGNVAPKLLAGVLMERRNRNLRTLDLGFNRISDRGAVLLAKALEENDSLESLYLSGNDIGPIGAAAIASALRRNSSLRSLHLSGNNIGEDGAKEIAEGLKHNRGLRSLYIGTNGIGSKGMKCLAEALVENTHLEELTLGQNKIGSDGVKHLATVLISGNVQLTTLEIGKNAIDSDGVVALAKALAHAPNRLQNLYVDNNPIGDVGASAFGALLAKNAMLRVLDLSYTQMSLLGLRELSVGLSYSVSLLCLLLDGHDWASTQYMKKTNGLNGMSLSAKGASNFAASCIVGAINSNPKSVLHKLSGVDMTLVLGSLPLSPADREVLTGETDQNRETGVGPRRSMDTLTRNEQILRYLQQQRSIAAATMGQKRKKTNEGEESSQVQQRKLDSPSTESSEPQPQRQKTGADTYHKLRVDVSAPAEPSPGSTTSSPAAAHAVVVPVSRNPLHRAHLPRHPSWPAEQRRLAVKSPRYESTIEVHVRKVLSDIARMPFNADEYATLQTYYLGGCHGPTPATPAVATAAQPPVPTRQETVATTTPHVEQVPCPACRSSRIARYPRTMVLKTRLEARRAADSELLVLLRQLHYLIGVFRNIDGADAKVDQLLVSIHEPPSPHPRQRQPRHPPHHQQHQLEAPGDGSCD